MIPINLHEYQINVWYSAKCGCSTIKSILQKFIFQSDVEDEHHLPEGTGHPFWKIHYKNILIVRNPATRLIACYLDKYDFLKTKFFQNQDFTFATFVARIESEWSQPNSTFYDHHFARQFEERFEGMELQYVQQYHKRFRFDFVYKLETMDFVWFLKHHFQKEVSEIPHNRNVTKKNNNYYVAGAYAICKPQLLNEKGEACNYECFLNDELKAQIKRIYYKDYMYMAQYGIVY